MADFLPDTAIATIARSSSEIYVYTQTPKGTLQETVGGLGQGGKYDAQYTDKIHRTSRHSNKTAPKIFTPLAACSLSVGTVTRHVFYLDDENYLHELRYKNNQWEEGPLYNQMKVQCAHYSQLAAISQINQGGSSNYQFISVIYQTPEIDGDIKMVNYSTYHDQWSPGEPDLADPPLLGTSISVVIPQRGIILDHDWINGVDHSKLPVVLFQFDTLGLASSQDDNIKPLSTNKEIFSPHTTLAAVDDGSDLYCFYAAYNGQIEKLKVDSDGNITKSEVKDATATPHGSLAASILQQSSEKMVLFYQTRNPHTLEVEILGLTYTKSGNNWTPSLPANPLFNE